MAFLASAFYYFFGFVSALYIVILWNKIFSSKSDDSTLKTPVRFYLNIFFLDRKELLRNMVRSKVSRNMPVLRALTKRAAVALLNNVIVEKVAQNLCKLIPDQMNRSGIRGTVNVIYTKHSYLCIEVALNKIDIPALVEFQAGETAGLKVRDMIERFSFPKLNELINYLLLTYMFQRKLMEKLPGKLKQKLQDKMFADMEIFACTEEELGPYLAQTLLALNGPQTAAAPETSPSPEK